MNLFGFEGDLEALASYWGPRDCFGLRLKIGDKRKIYFPIVEAS
jgi:hypothetical protein